MTTKSLRDTGADAATAVAVDPDAALMGLIADFHTAYAESRAAHDKWIAEKQRVEALPECPPFKIPAADREGYERFAAFSKEHGVSELSDRSNELWRGVGRLVEAVFSTEAHTLRGALEKLKIVYLGGDDVDLDGFDISEEKWHASVMRDFERLAGEAGDETLVALWAKYRGLRDAEVPDEIKGSKARDEYVAGVVKEMAALEVEILATPAQARPGDRVHVALLAWMELEAGAGTDWQPHLRRLMEGTPEKAVDVEDMAIIKFPASPVPEITWDKWLEHAKAEFLLFHLIVPVVNAGDDEVERMVRESGKADAYMDLVEQCTDSAKTYEAGAEIVTAAKARLMIILSRIATEGKAEGEGASDDAKGDIS